MAPLISEDLPCVAETIDGYKNELEVRRAPFFSKDTDRSEKAPLGGLSYDLAKIIEDAQRNGRAIHGVFDCAKLLTNDPESVTLCVLPETDDQCDVTVHIQQTLIQAFCWENDIQMIKVDCVDKLANLLKVESPFDASVGEMSCVLIQAPVDGLTPEMERVSQYIDHVIFSDVYPRPVIKLPE